MVRRPIERCVTDSWHPGDGGRPPSHHAHGADVTPERTDVTAERTDITTQQSHRTRGKTKHGRAEQIAPCGMVRLGMI